MKSASYPTLNMNLAYMNSTREMKNEMKKMKGVGRFVFLFFFLSLSFSLPLSSVRSFAWMGRGRRIWDRVVRESRDRGFRVSKNGKPALSCKARVGWGGRYDHQSLRFAHTPRTPPVYESRYRRTFREMELFVARNDGENTHARTQATKNRFGAAPAIHPVALLTPHPPSHVARHVRLWL